MNRRKFILSSSAAAVAGGSLLSAGKPVNADAGEFYELRKYILLPGESGKKLNNYLKNALIPALNRIGVNPVGVFKPQHGDDRLTKYVLIPHKTAGAFFTNNEQLNADKEYLRVSEEVNNAPLTFPVFQHYNSSFFKAFSHIPVIEVPDISGEYSNRIFELRIYQSQSYLAGQKKIEMFNEGGELEIFRKTGLTPVFFGEALFGTNLPNLTYMLVFKNLSDREKSWDVFRNHPDWKSLSAKEEYTDIVSNITSLILQPESFSQV